MKRGATVIVLLNSNFLYFLVLLVSLGAGLWLLGQPAYWASIPSSTLVSGKKVVIDAGHGGDDPGAKTASGLAEKHINLDIALKLKRYLSMAGIYCVMVRENDRDFSALVPGLGSKKQRDLFYRVRLANQSGAHIYLSIHANSFPQHIYRGAQTFYPRNDPESERLAKTVQRQLVRHLGPNKRQAKIGDYRVLNDTKMPSVTIEVGFLSNPAEAALLASPEYRSAIAKAVYEGVVNYFLGTERDLP